MARKITVWMVHGKTSLAGVKGELQLDDGDEPSAARAVVLNQAGDLGEESVVPALAYARSGVDLGSSLAYQDGTCGDRLALEALHPKPLGLGVTAVPG